MYLQLDSIADNCLNRLLGQLALLILVQIVLVQQKVRVEAKSMVQEWVSERNQVLDFSAKMTQG